MDSLDGHSEPARWLLSWALFSMELANAAPMAIEMGNQIRDRDFAAIHEAVEVVVKMAFQYAEAADWPEVSWQKTQ